jgi:hypothetical protein
MQTLYTLRHFHGGNALGYAFIGTQIGGQTAHQSSSVKRNDAQYRKELNLRENSYCVLTIYTISMLL